MGLSLAANPLELFIPGLPPACPDPVTFISGTWLIAKTLSRCEKALAHFLFNAGVPYLLPMISTRTASRNTVLLPLFPGFVFILSPFPPASPTTPTAPTAISALPPAQIANKELNKELDKQLELDRRHAADAETKALALASRQTCGFIWANNQPRFISELRVLAAESAFSRTLRFEAAHIFSRKRGTPIRITRGPMMGITGSFLQKKDSPDRIIIELTTLGRTVSVEISEAMIENMEQ